MNWHKPEKETMLKALGSKYDKVVGHILSLLLYLLNLLTLMQVSHFGRFSLAGDHDSLLL